MRGIPRSVGYPQHPRSVVVHHVIDVRGGMDDRVIGEFSNQFFSSLHIGSRRGTGLAQSSRLPQACFTYAVSRDGHEHHVFAPAEEAHGVVMICVIDHVTHHLPR